MAIIGLFTKDNDTYTGSISTLALTARLTFEPLTTKKNQKSPDYRILLNGSDIGAAWKKTSREGAEYLTVSLDDPTFAAPLQCSLFKTNVEHIYHLVWERRRDRD